MKGTEQEAAQTGALTPLQKAYLAIRELRGKLERLERAGTEPIAVIGMGCRVPGARNPESFWELVRDGRDAITSIPPDRWDASANFDQEAGRPGKSYIRHGGFLDEIDHFDAAFFGISPREASIIDPQHRLLLEVTWEALEYAGLPPIKLAGGPTGVFVGVTANDYGWLLVEQADKGGVDPYFHTGNALNACAGRIAYTLGLQGPCMAVDTACSSSLTAVHLACTSLRARECAHPRLGGQPGRGKQRLYRAPWDGNRAGRSHRGRGAGRGAGEDPRTGAPAAGGFGSLCRWRAPGRAAAARLSLQRTGRHLSPHGPRAV